MKFEDLKFMQLFGNCACIKYLGKDRLKGPVDNVDCRNLDTIKLLLTNKYYETLMSAPYTTEEHIPMFEKDSNTKYLFDFVHILHINPFTEEHKEQLKLRIKRFNNFYKKVKTNENYYFTISLNSALIDRFSHKLNKKLCFAIINYLREQKLLSKCIFVGTKLIKGHNDWNYWSPEFIKIVKQYKLKYVEIKDLSLFHQDTSQKQFKQQVWKYLKPKPKVEKSNYLYF